MKKLFLFTLLSSLILTGCGGRDISTVGNALIGHWIETNEDSEDMHIYISSDKFTTVINGTQIIYHYEKVSENDGRKEITITTKSTEDKGLKYRLNFTNEEMTEIESTADVMEIKNTSKAEQEALNLIEILSTSLNVDTQLTTTWKYVDEKIKP